MTGSQGNIRNVAPTVVVTALPVVAFLFTDQPLYHVFLYYAIELVVMITVLCAVTLIVSPGGDGHAIDLPRWSSRSLLGMIASVVAVGIFAAGIWLYNFVLCFIGAVAGFLVAPGDRGGVDWHVQSRIQFTLGITLISLLSTGIISVMIWQMGAIISDALTGESPPAGTITWLEYLGDVSLPLLTAVIAVLLCDTAYQIYQEVISSGKYRQTTPDQLLIEYLKIGVGIPALIWGLVLCSLAPVLVVVMGAAALGVDWIARGIFDVWILLGLGIYIWLQSYVDWHRFRTRQAWQQGNYQQPLFPSNHEVMIPLIGQITIAPDKKRE